MRYMHIPDFRFDNETVNGRTPFAFQTQRGVAGVHPILEQRFRDETSSLCEISVEREQNVLGREVFWWPTEFLVKRALKSHRRAKTHVVDSISGKCFEAVIVNVTRFRAVPV